MNNLQPYEKHLAEQLRDVPVPDKEAGWEEMRKLLDRDRPVGGGAWSGNKKWYWMGLTVLLIIGGLWGSNFTAEKQKQLANSGSNENKIPTQQHNTSNVRVTENRKQPIQTSETNNHNPAIESSVANNVIQSEHKSISASEDQKTGIDNITLQHTTSTNKPKSDLVKLSSLSGERTYSDNVYTELPDSKNIQTGKANSNNSADQKIITADNKLFTENSLGSNEPLWSFTLQPGIIADSYIIPAVPENAAGLQVIHGKTDKEFIKEARIKGMEADNRKMSKRSLKGNFGEKQTELTFAAGLALPKTFAVGSQQVTGYGISGKTNLVSDFLPVPYFQYHLNDKMFVQAELHFQSPQYTDKLLVYQKQQELSQNGRLEKNIFVEKLYYFNIPLNFYFSPARNFYIGSGIQFSSLLSGLASYEEKRYAGSNLENSSSKIVRFKDDSVASKLAPGEMRYQFDANYYVKRFTLGMRFNQAMKHFVNVQPTSVLPYTKGRNEAFLLYLRYNIWEERRKNKY